VRCPSPGGGRTTPTRHPLLCPPGLADPYPWLHALRARDPVCWDDILGGWVLTRYDDVRTALADPRLSADRISPAFQRLPRHEQERQAPVYRNLSRWMVFTDPPDHTRLRRLVHRAFTPRRVEALVPRIERLVTELVEAVASEGAADLVADLAYPLPAVVIAEALGVPREDRDRFKGWSDDITGLVFGALDAADRHDRARQGIAELERYLGGLVEERRRERRDDLISALVEAEEDGEALTGVEVTATCTLLLFAGHETTTNLIANGVIALLGHPGELRRLRADPSLARSAVEEVLRYEGPSRAQLRVATEPLVMRGRRIEASQRVYLMLAAANRDPARFDQPDHLRIDRAANDHLAFGYGTHYCIGAALARAEGRLALTALARRLDDLALAVPVADLPWQQTVLSRGVDALPVTFGRS
jgi:cytochrome P450